MRTRLFASVFVSSLLAGAASAAGPGGLSVRDFFGDFEDASLINPSQTGPDAFSVEVQSNQKWGAQGSLGTWACAGIRLSHLKAGELRSVRITVPNGNRIADLKAVYSYDRKTWTPVETQRSSFDFDVPLGTGHEAVYFATFYPYTYSQMQAHNRVLAQSRYTTVRTIGKSVHGREIPLVTITDGQAQASGKRRVFLIGGMHGAETASIYGVEGMLNFLTSDDPAAREMRQEAVWEVIPILNVDAAAEGLDRRNAAGINLYFDWGHHNPAEVQKLKNATKGAPPDPSIPTSDYTQPETQAAIAAIRAFKPEVFLDVHSWHFAGDGFWGPDPAAESQLIKNLKNAISKFYAIQHWDHEEYGFTSAPSVAHDYNIGATLTEFALSYDNDKHLKTPDSMRAQGVEILRGVSTYLKELR